MKPINLINKESSDSLETARKSKIYFLPLNNLFSNPLNKIYEDYDIEEELEELIDSISKTGLQHPITVSKAGDSYVIIDGHRTIISEFIKSDTKKDLVIITNVEKNKFYKQLLKKTSFEDDPRIKFVGTVYDKELLKKIREEAFAYIHGHSVGGTNPSLLEALASTKVNLLYDVEFNKEIANDSADYWNKHKETLSLVIERLENKKANSLNGTKKEDPIQIIKTHFLWAQICREYETLFINVGAI